MMCATKFAQFTVLSSKIKHFYTNRNYFNDAKTNIEPYFLNEWLYMSDFLVCILYKTILKHVFDNFFKFFYNVLDMKKALSISASCPEVPTSPYAPKI
jgi:hypothetical protein